MPSDAPFVGYPSAQKYANAKRRAENADVNQLPDPLTYAAMASFLGTPPDQLGFSALHPRTEVIRSVAEPAFAVGTAAQVVPALAALKRATAPARLVGGYSGAVPMDEFQRNLGRFKAAVPEGRTPFYHVTDDVWEGITPRKGTWFSNEPPPSDSPFGSTVRAYTVPSDVEMSAPLQRGGDFWNRLQNSSAPVAVVDDSGVTSYVVQDPSVLQRLEVPRGFGLKSPRESQRGALGDLKESAQRYYRASTSGTIRPGMFLTPDETAARRFADTFGLPDVSSYSVRPRRSGNESDVERVAKSLGIHEKGVPVDQYLMQGPETIYPESRSVLEELKNSGLDSLLLDDGISKQRSLYVIDPDIVRKYAKGGEVDMEKAAFGIYPRQRATPSSEETKRAAGVTLPELVRDYLLPQDAVDVGLGLAMGPGGKLARKAGAALIAGGAAGEAEAGGSRLVKHGANAMGGLVQKYADGGLVGSNIYNSDAMQDPASAYRFADGGQAGDVRAYADGGLVANSHTADFDPARIDAIVGDLNALNAG